MIPERKDQREQRKKKGKAGGRPCHFDKEQSQAPQRRGAHVLATEAAEAGCHALRQVRRELSSMGYFGKHKALAQVRTVKHALVFAVSGKERF